MVDAIPSLVTEKAFKLFGDFGVYTKEELVARAEIEYESYAKSVNIEAKAMNQYRRKAADPGCCPLHNRPRPVLKRREGCMPGS